MDSRKFDALTKVLAIGRSRRKVLRGVVCGTLVAGLTRFGLEGVAAGCQQIGQNCDANDDCCTKKCKQGECKCLKLREKCTDSAHCCGQLTCAKRKPDCGAGKSCCKGIARNCTEDCDCCGAMVCGSNDCQDGSRCCLPAGFPCVSDCRCCSGRSCVDPAGTGVGICQ